MPIPTTLSIRRPDDWHVHLRDGAALQSVVPYTARQFARAIACGQRFGFVELLRVERTVGQPNNLDLMSFKLTTMFFFKLLKR